MWFTRWQFRTRVHWNWWIVGLSVFPGEVVTICLGPVGLEFFKTRIRL